MRKYIFLLIVVACGLTFAYVTSDSFGLMYRNIVGMDRTSGFDSLVGLPISYIFFMSLFFPFLSLDKKWVYVILLSPAILFTFTIGQDEHFYFPYLFLPIGLVIGFLVKKLIKK